MPKSTTMTAEEARRAADDAARIARELEAAEEAKRREEEARHAAAVEQWWADLRDSFPERVRGKRDAAYAAFRDAVLSDDGNPTAAYARYCQVDAEVAELKNALDQHYARTDREEVDAEVIAYQSLLRAAGYLRAVADGDVVPADLGEVQAQMEAHEQRLEEWNRTHDELGPHGIGLPRRPVSPSQASGLAYVPMARPIAFAAAVDEVIGSAVREHLATIHRERADAHAAL